MSGGIVRPGAGNPWWTQNNGNSGYGNVSTLQGNAPAGYTYDPVQQRYTPTTNSAANSLEEQNRRRLQEDRLNAEDEADFRQRQMFAEQNQQRSTQQWNQYQSNQQSMQSRLDSMLNGLKAQEGSGPSGPSGGSATPQVTMQQQAANPSTITYGGAGTGTASNLSMEVDKAASAAQNAAFGKAKATAGSLGQSAVNTLRSNLAERGLVGGGSETRGITDRLAAATNPLSDINVAQLDENATTARHNQDLGAAAAATAYQGGITQRGQDIAANNANADRSLNASTTNANNATQMMMANASIAAQKQLALKRMQEDAMNGLLGLLGRRY